MKVFVITIERRKDRQERITQELDKWKIPFEFYFAKEGSDNQSRCISNQNAHREIMRSNKDEELLMILEDDCYFTQNPMEIPIPKGEWWQYYLGANIINQTFKGPEGWSILQGAWGAYCIIYTKAGMQWIIEHYHENTWPNPCYDDFCRGRIHLKGKSLIKNELIARTYPTFSDIDQHQCDYEKVIENSYKFISR